MVLNAPERPGTPPELTDHHYRERASALVDHATLRDGTRAWVGPLLPTDREDLAAEYETLSFTTKRHRFLGGVAYLNDDLLDLLVDGVDGVDHVALVIFVEVDGEPAPVGIARMVRYRDRPDAADIAVTVKDEWQGRGVASALLPFLMARRPDGVTHLLTEVADDNSASLAMLRRLGPTQIHRASCGELDVEVDLTGEGHRHEPPADGARLHPVLAATERHDLRHRDRTTPW